MKLCCPACGFMAAIETFGADKAARRFAALMGRVPPPLSDLVLRYCGLFAPAKHAMTFTKGERVLGELVPMIEAGRVTRAKREWTVNLAQWEAGLQAMCDKRAQLTLPLKSHGYLLEVLAGSADKLEAKAEAGDIERQRTGEARKETDQDESSGAAAWDAERRAEVAKMAAVRALAAERASLAKLKMTPTAALVRDALLKQGHVPAAIDFAFSKLVEPLP